jgi:TolB-like protein
MQRVSVAVVLCCLLLIAAGCGSSAPPAPKKPKINVGLMPFEARAGVQPGEAESVGDLFAAALQNSGRFTVIERKQLAAIMQEREFQASQEDNAQLAKAGKAMAIRKMISGSIGKLGDKYLIHLKMIDVESTSIDLAVSQTYEDNLGDIGKEFIPELIGQLISAVDGPPKP